MIYPGHLSDGSDTLWIKESVIQGLAGEVMLLMLLMLLVLLVLLML